MASAFNYNEFYKQFNYELHELNKMASAFNYNEFYKQLNYELHELNKSYDADAISDIRVIGFAGLKVSSLKCNDI